ncbi:tetratricopeptide repeat protein [Flavobacterium sp. AG291]|uniref:tetratricopeptide repeat protein n=1 Tax=Flavobacterium sp. AG291 TaxID=2184000 RepID=UPI000E0BD32F|nr:tetratricopeptide repeat protein [Flavobacterium sp. AG291]RDI08183.1 tetratricopeptide repeat protein [Flavobacterium sp. AG291]
MKELKFLGLSLLFFGVASAQDVNEAKKAIDAEQYQKAKTILNSLISSSPDEGKNYFFLGDVYLKQTEQDSAAIFFNKGKAVKNNAEFNNIGLGQIDLNAGNTAAAQAKFDAVEKELGKRDVEQLIYIGRAYINAEKPDYAKAIAVLNKAVAKDSKSAQAYLSLGDAYYGERKQSEAYSAYRNALLYDSSLLRAKLQMAVITKNTRVAFPEAIKAFDAIVASNPNYGPVYRELAETYYIWGVTEPAKKKEYNAKALSYYEKYMTLTDYSLNSRMRRADFLLLTDDYKGLEAEALKMQQMDKVNPRILRYLAYSQYENGKYTESSASMKEWIAKADPKRIIARDYLYLGLSNLASSVGQDAQGNAIITNQAAFDEAIANIQKAAETDINITNEFGAVGQKLFKQKLYGPAAVVYGVATTNPDNKNLMADNFFYAYSLYFDHVNKSAEAQKGNVENLKKADTALAKVIELNAQSQDAYLYRAKVNRYIQTPEALKTMAESYDKYIEIVNAAGQAEVTKQKKNLLDAYSNAGAYYAVTDKAKATEYFNKALSLDPNDEYVKGQLKSLK